MTKATWMIRSGDRGYLAPEFRDAKITAIGWSILGDIRSIKEKSVLVDKLKQADPEESHGNHLSSAGQLLRFVNEVKNGDSVITYHADSRMYFFGEVKSEALFDVRQFPEYPNQRSVHWTATTGRDSLTQASRNVLGSTLTLFKVPNEVAQELVAQATSTVHNGFREKPLTSAIPDRESTRQIFSDQQELALSMIEDTVNALDWEEMQELVASLLRAMRYKTTVSPKGADRGKDIFASPDGLGFEEPRIFVEVKHRIGSMGTPDVRSFVGGRRAGDRCLYVSTGGFTQEAKYEAERSAIPITLLNLRDLVSWLLDYYEELDGVGKELLPLRRLYWPLKPE
jgi:restriction system protein